MWNTNFDYILNIANNITGFSLLRRLASHVGIPQFEGGKLLYY